MRPWTRGLVLAAALGVGLGPARAQPRREPGQVVRVEHRDPDTVPSRGPASAPVTVEFFFLPNTNAQARLPSYKQIQRLQESHPNRIRVVYRLVKRSQHQLSNALLEAHAQGKFFDLMEVLHQSRNTASLGKADVLDLAKRAGLDVPRVAAAIDDGRYAAVLEANDHRLARITRGQPSVPAVLFNARPPRSGIASMSDADYEREYADARERALELIDRGVDPRSLMEAFDTLALRSTQPYVGAPGPTDDDVTGAPLDHKLASPPLSLAGMPSYGKPDAKGAIPVVLLCRPNDTQCGKSLEELQKVQRRYPDDVRLVWAPWFDVSRDDAADLTLLGDAVLCAEQVGTSPDLSASPGWRWIERQLHSARGSHGRRSAPEKLIDDITAEVGIDSPQLSACRARTASATLRWIERARRSGVTRAPAIVVGGRIYEGVPAEAVVQQLVEAELAPGVLGELAPAWPRAHR